MSYFFKTQPFIEGNKKLRLPQIEAYIKIKEYFLENPNGEALVILPTGTGKSGVVSIAPYGVCKKRVLVITPGLVTKKSIVKTLHPLEDNFWLNFDVLFSPEDMPVVEEYEPEMLDSSLENCDFVVANIHKLYKNNQNSLLNRVPPDFFDMIIVDEAHHCVADTWQDAFYYFNDAKKLHLTGTPYRGDYVDLPGEIIHNTSLSEVMRKKYVKWLRKRTVNNQKMYFSIPGSSKQYTKDEVLNFKDKEWVEKSVALSRECSMDVINESINKLNELKELSPNVNHKILAVATSILHAEDVSNWYSSQGKSVVIVHSGLDKKILENNLLKIENHQCEVVVSVNMLMEGYDHKYLSVLSLFRPYRSQNAFAQIVGRVLRAIPENEITDFAIDNNAYIIYHQETGLDTMWEFFSNEVIKSKKQIDVEEHQFSEREYLGRETLYAGIEIDDSYVNGSESYLDDIDFNEMFEAARKNIDEVIERKISNIREVEKEFDSEDLELLRRSLRKKAIQSKKTEIDDLLISKRPEKARKMIRDILYKNANDAVQDILTEIGIDPKDNSLYNIFKKHLRNLKSSTPNDGILVWYINDRVRKKYGPVKQRTPENLSLSERYMNTVINELRRMLRDVDKKSS